MKLEKVDHKEKHVTHEEVHQKDHKEYQGQESLNKMTSWPGGQVNHIG